MNVQDSVRMVLAHGAVLPSQGEIIALESKGRRPAGPLAQRLEQRTHNPSVVGSNPTGPTKRLARRGGVSFCNPS